MPKHVRKTEQSLHASESKYRNWEQYTNRRQTLDPFKDLLQRDPRVCDNCFILRYEEINLEWWRGTFGWLPYKRMVPIAPADRHERFHPERVTTGTRLTCGKCGHRDTKKRPLPKDDVHTYATHISNTLSEKGIEHDQRLLEHSVQRRNVSANQGRQDSHVFAPAVRAAIEAEHEDVQAVVQRHLYDG